MNEVKPPKKSMIYYYLIMIVVLPMYQCLDCTGFKRTKNSGGGLQHLFEYAE